MDALATLSWKAYGGGEMTNILLSMEYVTMSFTLVMLMASLVTFLSPRKNLFRRYMQCNLVLFAMQTILVIQNLVTYNSWYLDGSTMVHGPLYPAIFIIPLLQNLLYIAACLHTSTVKLRGFGFALLMTLSLVAVACMLPKYYSTIHYMFVLFPVLLILPYVYNLSGYELENGMTSIEHKKEALSVSKVTGNEIDHALEILENLEYMPDDASDALGKLRRYISDNYEFFGSTSCIPLDKELDNVEAFIYLEKLRYRERLTIEYELDETAASVPPLCMQILVENAVKHGISKRPEGGTVRISTERRDDSLAISVTDNGVGFDVNAPLPNVGRRHVGVDNLKARLEAVGGTLVIDSTPDVGTVATIIIPING